MAGSDDPDEIDDVAGRGGVAGRDDVAGSDDLDAIDQLADGETLFQLLADGWHNE